MDSIKIIKCILSQALSQLYGKSQEKFYQIVVNGSDPLYVPDILFTLLALWLSNYLRFIVCVSVGSCVSSTSTACIQLI
jgi:hypothetical protein